MHINEAVSAINQMQPLASDAIPCTICEVPLMKHAGVWYESASGDYHEHDFGWPHARKVWIPRLIGDVADGQP